jgi:hypothetical protein
MHASLKCGSSHGWHPSSAPCHAASDAQLFHAFQSRPDQTTKETKDTLGTGGAELRFNAELVI